GLVLALVILAYFTGNLVVDFEDIWKSVVVPALILSAVVILIAIVIGIVTIVRDRREELQIIDKGEVIEKPKEEKTVKDKPKETKSEDEENGDKEPEKEEKEPEMSHPTGIVGLGNIKQEGGEEDYDEEEDEE
ncbi:hypothetical protein ACFLRC_00710, partial [Candidatus Altiarchaeota archaeon]